MLNDQSVLQARLPSHMILSALKRQCDALGIGYFIRLKGDPDRGGIILIFQAEKNLYKLYERVTDFNSKVIWRLYSEKSYDGMTLMDMTSKLKARDPDLHLIDLECDISALILDAPLDQGI